MDRIKASEASDRGSIPLRPAKSVDKYSIKVIKMEYGFENDKFYIELTSRTRPVGNMREESDRRARDLAEQGGKFMLGNSGGLDSQSVLHSFHTQGIPIESAFLYLPGHNDNELEQVRFIDRKYGITTQIIDIDPIAVQKEIEDTADELDISAKNNVLQRKFLSMLPSDYDFVQMVHDPYVFVYPNYQRFGYFQGYYLPEISRARAFNSLGRTGRNIFYGNTEEFLLSIIADPIFRAALLSARYFDGNGVTHPNKHLKTVDRWDFYIKPLLYGRYWGDELTYFPKYAGFETVEYLHGNSKFRQHAVIIPYAQLIEFIKVPGGIKKRFYENVPAVN